MTTSETYFRLIIRFSNGETARFVLREPLDTGGISDRTRFALVRTHDGATGAESIFVANLADISYVKTEQIEGKEVRQRVAGIASALSAEGDAAPNDFSTVEFV